MSSMHHDVRTEEERTRITNTVLDWLSDVEGQEVTAATAPNCCCSCGEGGVIQWLDLTVDWEEHLCRTYGIERPDDVCRVPLCTRCRAWAEIIEIAEMSLPYQSESDRRRIVQERNRLLETLDVELIRGIRLSRELSAFSR